MRTRQFAAERISFGAIAPRPGTQHRFYRPTFHDTPNHVVLGVGGVQGAIGGERETLRSSQLGSEGRPAVATVSLLAGPGDSVQSLGRRVDAIEGIAFPKGQEQIAIRGQRKSSRPVEGRAPDGRRVGRRFRLSSAGVRLDEAIIKMNATDALVADVADE